MCAADASAQLLERHASLCSLSDAVLLQAGQLQSTGTPAARRAWLLAREIDLLQTELESSEAPVFIMGRAHVRLRTDSNW